MSVSCLVSVFAFIPQIALMIPAKLGYADTHGCENPAEYDFLESGEEVFALAESDFTVHDESIESEETLLPSLPPDGGNEEYEDEPSIPVPDPSSDDLPVFSENLCWYGESDTPKLFVNNQTKYRIKLEDYLEREYPVKCRIPENGPLVLIMHTHGTESYLKKGYEYYSPEETFRSRNEENTVVHIGKIVAERLNKLGIPAIQDKTMYDTKDFNKSYLFSREGIKKFLSEYPTIRYVIDIHRDSIFNSDSENIKPLTVINGKKCAQIMIVAGTDDGGSDHPCWRDNMTVAANLQYKLNTLYPTLARPVNIRRAGFNQALTKGSLLLEMGSCGNTMEEAENSALLFADAYARVIKEHILNN